jgi:hypothetical protein
VVAWGNGSPIHPHALSRLFCGVVRAAGLRTIRLQDVRHTHQRCQAPDALRVRPEHALEELDNTRRGVMEGERERGYEQLSGDVAQPHARRWGEHLALLLIEEDLTSLHQLAVKDHVSGSGTHRGAR